MASELNVGTVVCTGALTGASVNASNGSSSFARTHATTTASLQILDLKATSSGDMADGFGPSIVFSASDTGVTSSQVAEINAVRAGSDTAFDLEFQTGDATRLSISSAGLATFSNGIDVTSTGNFSKLETTREVSVADDATLSLSAGGCQSAMISVYETASGKGGIFFITYNTAAILIASTGTVAATDSDGYMCVFKSTSSHTATFKNRMGSTKNFRVAQIGGYLG